VRQHAAAFAGSGYRSAAKAQACLRTPKTFEGIKQSAIVLCMSEEMAGEIIISERLYGELIHACLYPLPHKAFGLIGGKDIYHPKNIYPCSTNLRNEPEWRAIFESYGEFYLDPDLGFVIAASEVKQVTDMMASRKESFIGVFHSHRYLHAEPSPVDLATNSDPNMLCYIVSVVSPSAPVVGVFRLNGESYQSIPIRRIQERD
jgi:proteasome lid subunit RPN8/RPN11